MAWIRIDDHFDEHPKLAAAGPLGWALWMAGLAYCNRNQTDGFIPWSVARNLVNWEFLGLPDDEGRQKIYRVTMGTGHVGDNVSCSFVIDLLMESGLWEEVDGGYQVHDYSDYQPLKTDIEEQRAKKAAAGQAGGLAKAQQNASKPLAEPLAPARSGASKPLAPDLAKPKQNSSPNPNPIKKTNPIPKPEKEHINVPSPKTPMTRYVEGFEIFWSAYPRKDDRKAAEVIWNRIRPSPDLLATMLQAIERQGLALKDPQYRPLPTTWLNKERWNDQGGPAPPTRNGTVDGMAKVRELENAARSMS